MTAQWARDKFIKFILWNESNAITFTNDQNYINLFLYGSIDFHYRVRVVNVKQTHGFDLAYFWYGNLKSSIIHAKTIQIDITRGNSYLRRKITANFLENVENAINNFLRSFPLSLTLISQGEWFKLAQGLFHRYKQKFSQKRNNYAIARKKA